MTQLRQQDLPELPDAEKTCATWRRQFVFPLSTTTVLSFPILFHCVLTRNHILYCWGHAPHTAACSVCKPSGLAPTQSSSATWPCLLQALKSLLVHLIAYVSLTHPISRDFSSQAFRFPFTVEFFLCILYLLCGRPHTHALTC